MKPRFLIGIALAGVSVFLVSAGSIVMTNIQDTEFPKKEMAIAFRQIGHELLLQAGDSISRVLPVKQLDEQTFQLEFQSDFTFVPDSLVGTVNRNLASTGIHQPYVVNVIECHTQEVIYGFQIGLQQTTTLVPCLGREQPVGCYLLYISFLETNFNSAQSASLFVLAFAGLALVVVTSRRIIKNKELLTIPETKDSIRIGAYTFYADRRILKYKNELVELSDKETKLLKIFSSNMNKPVPREHVMKEVWEDEGVIVGRSLDVFVSKLRKRLKQDPAVQLVNIHGVGYSLKIQN